MATTKRILVAITGASGVAYGVRLLEVLAGAGPAFAVLSDGAKKVLEHEGSMGPSLEEVLARHRERITLYEDADVAAGPSSGSFPIDGMAVCPCSMDTLAAIASGAARTLTQRAAHVTLKEGRKLVLVPRETPLNVIIIENLLRVARAGATVLPAAPAFYHKPRTIADQIDFIVGKTLDQFGIDHDLFRRWAT